MLGGRQRGRAGDEQPRLRQHLRDLGPRLGVGGAALAM